MLVKIYRENPNEKRVSQVVECLRSDGVIIYPTDGVYAFGCSLRSPKAIERLKALTGKDESCFSLVCADLSHLADYAKVDNTDFHLLKRNLPGPFTFIMNASSKVPNKVLRKRKTVGLRIPDNEIPVAIVRELSSPLLSASVKSDDRVMEYTTDPELIDELWGDRVDLVVDGGYGELTPTTLVDLTGDEPETVREGAGELIM